MSIFGPAYVGAMSPRQPRPRWSSNDRVDIKPAKLALIRDGKTPMFEEG